MALEPACVARELERVPRAVGVVGADHRLVARRGPAGERRCQRQRRRKVAQLPGKHKTQIPMPAAPAVLKDWRKSQRERLIAARMALSAGELERLRRRIDGLLELSFHGRASCRLAFCWTLQSGFDGRHCDSDMHCRVAMINL